MFCVQIKQMGRENAPCLTPVPTGNHCVHFVSCQWLPVHSTGHTSGRSDAEARARPSEQLRAFRGPHSQGSTVVCETQTGLLRFSGALQHPANTQLGLECLFSDSNLNISVSCSTSTQVFVASPRALPYLCGNLEQRFLVTLLVGICFLEDWDVY